MKIIPFLTIACCSIIVHSSEPARSGQEGDLLQRASAQLDRLAPYRRSGEGSSAQSTKPQEPPNVLSPDETLRELLLLQIYRQVPEELRAEVMKGIGRKNSDLLSTLTDPANLAKMEERIKRSGVEYGAYGHDSYGGDEYGEGGYEHPSYGHKDSGSGGSGGIISGSGSIISGIAGGIFSGIASASAGASKGAFSGSSQASAGSSSGSSDSKHKDIASYGHSYSHDEKQFDVWDIKKAIVNTLVQAIKAISGGVIALKGQLIKGSGFLVSTKGRIISSTGEAITSLGRHIAKSAVVTNTPKHPEYSYGPPEHHDDHESTYEGPPPPNAGEYGHDDYSGNSHYSSPSDDGDDHAGLLIAKPMEQDYNHHESPTLDLDHREPHVSHVENDYGSNSPYESHKEHHENNVPEHSHSHEHPNEQPHAEAYHLTQPPTSYDVPLHYPNSNKDSSHYPIYPPLQQDLHNSGNHQQDLHNLGHHQQDLHNLGHHQQDLYNLGHHQQNSYNLGHQQQESYNLGHHQHDSYNLGNHLAVQQSVEYPPVHIQQIEYSLPNKNAPLINAHSIKPHKDLSVYSSLSIGLSPELASLKISPLTHGNGFELPKIQKPENFHGSSGPLKIPLLSPLPTNHWYGHGFMQPATGFALYRRRSSSSQKHRRLGEDSSNVRNSMSASRNTRTLRV